MIAFLNTAGGALIFGVSDTALVEGMVLSEKQKDKVKLVLDNSIRNYKITPIPQAFTHYRFEFINASNDASRCLLVLEVQKSQYFHYAIVHSNFKSWERLNASNMSLNEQPHVFVKRISELRNVLEKNHVDVENLPNGFITLAFCDEEVVVNEQVLQQQKGCQHHKIYRFDLWCQMDRRGR